MAEATDERAQQDRQVGARMTGAVIVVSIFLFLGKVAGYVKEAIMADYWGLSGGLDAFKVVYNSVIILVYTKAEKLLRPTYLPIFVQHRDHDREDEAWRFFSTATNLSFLVLLAITALCTGFAPEIIRFVWPRLAPADVALAVSLLRISGAAMVLLVLSVMVEMTLHSYKRFTAPALAEATMRLILPVTIYGLVAAWGMAPTADSPGVPPQALRAAAIGVLIGAALRLLVQLPALGRKLLLFRPQLPTGSEAVHIILIATFWWVILLARGIRLLMSAGTRTPWGRDRACRARPSRVRDLLDRVADYGVGHESPVVRMVALMPPVVVGLLASSARTIFDSRFAVDAGEGVYTALDFARKISDAPILILPLAVALVVFPYVSEWASRENREMFTRSLLSMTRVMAFIFVPMAVGVIVLALPAIQFLYQGEGAFTVEDSYMVRRALIPYAVGIPFFAVESSLDKWYFALGDTATPNYVGAVMAGLHVLIAWFGVHVLGRNVGIIALALTASKGIKVIVLYAWLRRRLEAISRSEMLSFIGRLAVATAVLVVALLAGERAFGGLLVDAGRLQRGIYLVLCSGVGAVAYLIAALALRLEEVTEVIGFVRSKLLRRRGKG